MPEAMKKRVNDNGAARKTRDLIHDTQASSLVGEGAVIDDSRANNLYISDTDFKRLGKMFKRLRDELPMLNKAQGFAFNNNEYSYVKPQCRISIAEVGDDINYVKAELVFTRGGDVDQKWINVTYTLYKHNHSGPVLAFIGNPTTIVAGNNIRPIRIDDVGRFQETLYFYRLGFLLLKNIMHGYKFEWDKKTAKAVQLGKINVSNTQWALYLPTENKLADLNMLTNLFAARRGSEDSTCLAEYLGFESAGVLKGPNGKLTGLFLAKKRGLHNVLTINFYDKRQSVSNKKQGKSLNEDEIRLIDNALRVDITAHGLFLESIITAAKSHANSLMLVRPELRNKLKRFLLNKDERIDAYMICRAMSILAVQVVDGALYKGSFTSWLLQRVLEDELHLISILKYGSSYLHVEARDPRHNTVLRIWRSGKYDDNASLIAALCKHTNGSRAWVYKMRKQIIEAYGLDIMVPYNYWLDLADLNSAYGLSVTERALIYDAKKSKMSAKKAGNLLQDSDKKSSAAFNTGAQKLLHSLQLVATQVNAEKLDIRLLAE